MILITSNAKLLKINSRENTMNTAANTQRGPTTLLPFASDTPVALTQFLATVLLAAGVSALLVMTDRLMEGWAESHLVAAWLALWAVAVLAIVLLRGLTRVLAQNLMTHLDAWSAQLARRRADQRLWDMAQKDPRLMRDLEVAMDRAPEVRSPLQGFENRMTQRAARLVRDRLYYI
jgi:ABC-type multidrug transport system fused ATPase/permease subunit